MSSHPTTAGLRVRTVATPGLGDRTYLIHDGEHALVIDPQRDIERVRAVAEHEQVSISHIFETHIHNDYVSGGLALATQTGADYHVNVYDDVAYPRVGIRDGDVITIGSDTSVEVLATPGHTPTHLSFAISTPADDAPLLLTGGALLFGGSGRTDLLGPHAIARLATQQHESLQRLSSFPGLCSVLPTHGFGSYCATTSSGATRSTVEVEATTNPDVLASLETFIERSLEPRPYPAYYANMAPRNMAGATATPHDPTPRVPHEKLIRALEAGVQVVDLRPGAEFAGRHFHGSLNIPSGLQFATMVGWLLRPDQPLVLLAHSDDELDQARVELSRVGFDDVAGAVFEDAYDRAREDRAAPIATSTGYSVATFSELAAASPQLAPQVLDVRHEHEHAASHLQGSLNIPLPELTDNLMQLRSGHWWVHCASGFRASIAASALEAAGARLTLVLDDYENAQATSLSVIESRR